ncbi:hypothetical protein SI65_01274 [Aspergillus cristatus]|uniref:Uncharacterized protein n=1 Tax=Aspergillus cristatus TaxID=573508 RepID=A0A1E3BRV9_ASPCR|nr:hypothetical protein SI65_01274 [Aspergillus cristatus]
MNGLGTFPLYRLLSTPVFSYFPFSTVSPPMIMEMTTQPPVPLMQDDGPISKPCSNRNNRGNRSTREIRYRRTQITPYGRADYKVMHIKPCMSTLKKALKVYDPGLGEPTSEILERLVEIYNLQSIEWPSEADKQEIMQAKIDKDLKIALSGFGYRNFAVYAKKRRFYMEIAPDEGSPSAIPKWLQIPYLMLAVRSE